jgi:hypothetical protein
MSVVCLMLAARLFATFAVLVVAVPTSAQTSSSDSSKKGPEPSSDALSKPSGPDILPKAPTAAHHGQAGDFAREDAAWRRRALPKA